MTLFRDPCEIGRVARMHACAGMVWHIAPSAREGAQGFLDRVSSALGGDGANGGGIGVLFWIFLFLLEKALCG